MLLYANKQFTKMKMEENLYTTKEVVREADVI